MYVGGDAIAKRVVPRSDERWYVYETTNAMQRNEESKYRNIQGSELDRIIQKWFTAILYADGLRTTRSRATPSTTSRGSQQ